MKHNLDLLQTGSISATTTTLRPNLHAPGKATTDGFAAFTSTTAQSRDNFTIESRLTEAED